MNEVSNISYEVLLLPPVSGVVVDYNSSSIRMSNRSNSEWCELA